MLRSRRLHSQDSREDADLCSESLRRYKLGQISISALTASGAILAAFTDHFWLGIGTALSSFLTVWISSYMKGVDPGGIRTAIKLTTDRLISFLSAVVVLQAKDWCWDCSSRLAYLCCCLAK